jgi:hypothetical protein
MAREGTELTRRLTIVLLCVAIASAFYVGFRLPNAWATTLSSVSITDGFHRRFVVGTLLRPLAIATDYDYWLYAAFEFAVLAGLIAIVVRSALRTTSIERRLLIVAYFLLPTGGFLFHEVGYFEQELYLLLFVAIWLVRKQRLIAATAVMAVCPYIHEIAILTTLPIFGLVVLRELPFRRAAIMTAIPAIVNGIVLLLPPASEGAVATLTATLQQSRFATIRTDALELFNRSQAESWRLYTVHEVVVFVKPIAMFVVGAFAVLWWFDRGFWKQRMHVPAVAIFFASAAAVGLPGLLVYGGWDGNRWAFLLLTNFAIVTWLSLEEQHRSAPVRIGTCALLAVTILLTSHIELPYFAPNAPREFGYRPVRKFVREMRTGALFEVPGI